MSGFIPEGATHKKEMGVGTVYFRFIEVDDVFGKVVVWQFWDKYTKEWRHSFNPTGLVLI